MLNSREMTSFDSTGILINQNFTNDTDSWLFYEDNDGSNNRDRRLVDLIAKSKVTVILTHGSPTGICVSASDTDLMLTSSAISNLHKGYFSYSNLVFYLSCSTGGSTDDADTMNVMNATADRGAGAVVGFGHSVNQYLASAFEYTFLSHLGDEGSWYQDNSRYGQDLPIYSGIFDLTIQEATRKRAERHKKERIAAVAKENEESLLSIPA